MKPMPLSSITMFAVITSETSRRGSIVVVRSASSVASRPPAVCW